jgi:tRNA threonylcarbamoyladenosine biosynthesis protein TsaE
MAPVTIELADAAATEAAGARLARELAGGMVVALSGDLGTGKTTLVRGALRALGWPRAVKSPTFTVVEYYAFSSLYFYHFDFYRFADPDEWETAGLAECFRDDSVCLIEWPERVTRHLPEPDLVLVFSLPPDPQASGRLLQIDARTEAGERCRSAMIAADLGATSREH